MTYPATDILHSLAENLRLIMRGEMQRAPLQFDLAEVQAELVSECETFNAFLQQLQEAFQLSIRLAEGDVDVSLPRSNPLLMPMKAMQSNLNHLKWQVSQIASGDLNQQVHFLGDFSDSFNSMIESLKQKREIEQRLEIITSVLSEGVCLVDGEGCLSYVNPEGEKLLDQTRENLLGKPVVLVFKLAGHCDDADPVLLQFASALDKGVDFHSRELVVIHQDGGEMAMSLECRPIWQDDIYSGAVVAFHDISAQKRYELKLRQMNDLLEKQATTDSLTGIYNRLKLDQLLASEIDRALRYGNELSVVIVDIDHFKGVNDEFGHLAGDEVLKGFAQLLQNNLRSSDYVGRWGGEEFLLIFPQINACKVCHVVEKLRHLVESHKFPVSRQITSSFGVTDMVKTDTTASLTARADNALYRAKESGRNRVEMESAVE